MAVILIVDDEFLIRDYAEQMVNDLGYATLSAGDLATAHAFLHSAHRIDVLFTDIRGSSQLIREMAPRDFFEDLNQLLSTQARHVQKYQGSVIKYTGDGVMAVFRGMGRSYLALRCGLELAGISNDRKFPFGIGIAQGLVLAGLIGDSNRAGQRSQYDVVGATVHLASRLCGLANVGEVLTVKSMNVAARVSLPEPRPLPGVSVRGFDNNIDCVVFAPSKDLARTSGAT